MLGSSQGFSIFFLCFGVLQVLYGINCVMTTKKMNQVNRDGLSKWRAIVKKASAKKN